MRLFWFIAVLLVFGCNSEKQLIKSEVRLAKAGLLPKICADRYPQKDTIIYKDSIRVDSLYEYMPIPVDGEIIYDTILKTIVKTVYKEKIVRFQDMAKINDLQMQLEAVRADLKACNQLKDKYITQKESAENKAKNRLWLWLVVLFLLIWTFRKYIGKWL